MRGTRCSSRSSCERIYDNGDVYQDVYAGLYCVGCEAFKSEDELVDGKCPDHGVAPEWIEEKNWFFRLSAYQERLLQLYEERPDFVLPGFRANEAKGFIAGGLRDFSISRAGQTWGVPIPWDPEQVAYVWADALVNYRSALEYARPGEDLTHLWSGVRHLLGKDILRFHCVYWPALLLSAGYEVPRQLFVHGFLNLDSQKISKSLGNVVDPLELIDEYGVDPVRFWIARAVQFGQDGNVSLDTFRERYERELGNDLGNLLSRTTAMISRYRNGELKPVAGDGGELAEAIARVQGEVPAALDVFDITGALETIWELVRRLNRHVEQTQPWQLAKDEGRAEELDRVLFELADGLRCVAIALSAYVPETASRILEALGQPLDLSWEHVRLRPHGHGDRDRGGAAALPPHRCARDRGVIDTHAHLDGCDEPAGELLARARGAGVTRVITVGTGIESCRTALALAAEHDGVYAALGIDPHQAAGDEASRIAELRELLGRPKVVAVGETGLDNHHDFATADEQRRLFDAQIELATETELPLVVHSREADEQTAEALASFEGTVVLHCFSSAGLLPAALERGYYVSFAGNVTYPRAVELREAAARVPAELILAETDSPYLAPQPLRGRPNEPAHVLHTVAALAEARGDDADELAAQIDANATAAFGL